jgi:hypothetical protein
MELTNYTIGCDPGSPSGSHSIRYLAMDNDNICKMAEEVREAWHRCNYKSGAFCGEDHSDNYYSGGDDAIDLFKELMLAKLKDTT